ncbi:hypothetical protein FACS1894187_15420 [Synergistales bacterium]|nr:hypothetical protein FACS1894187_15420 [Synergistales bacterium]
MNIKFFTAIVMISIISLFFQISPARAVVVEADRDVQLVMGDLSALSVAARLYYDEKRAAKTPLLEDLSRYFTQPLPQDGSFQVTVIDGELWIGRKVPERSNARAYLRGNAAVLGVYDKDGKMPWLGGAGAWIKAMDDSRYIRVAQGENKDSNLIFYNIAGTENFWWSDLTLTPQAKTSALKKLAAQDVEGFLAIPPAPVRARETLTASPVHLPPEFSMNEGKEPEEEMTLGKDGPVFNPLPMQRQY